MTDFSFRHSLCAVAVQGNYEQFIEMAKSASYDDLKSAIEFASDLRIVKYIFETRNVRDRGASETCRENAYRKGFQDIAEYLTPTLPEAMCKKMDELHQQLEIHNKKQLKEWRKQMHKNPSDSRLQKACDRCPRWFRVTDDEMESGCIWHCASEFRYCPLLGRWFLFGGYGSTVLDNGTMEVLHPEQVGVPLKTENQTSRFRLCDFCIEELTKAGHLIDVIASEGCWCGPPEWKDEYWIIRHQAWDTLATDDDFRSKWLQGRTMDQLRIRKV